MNYFNQASLVILSCYLTFFSAYGHNDRASYFPTDYKESRTRFLKAVSELKALVGDQVKMDSFPIGQEGGFNLYTDFVYLDCKKDHTKSSPLLLLTSGVHGPESRVGTAAQIWFLKNESLKRCKQGLSQVYFHALNPYGFHMDRRFTGNNVDLNRNFPTKDGIYDTSNEAYRKLESVLNPKKEVKNLVTRSMSLFKQLLSRLVNGLSTNAIRQASVGGQYDYSEGIYFGGHSPEPVVNFMTEKISKAFGEHSDVLHYDFHTGLGKKGVLHMIVGPKLSSYGNKVLNSTFRPLAKGQYEVTTSQDPGFYKVEGDIIDFVSGLKNDGRIISFTVEYGTVGLGLFAQLKTLTRLVNENQGHHHGYKNSRVKQTVKKRLRDVFHPPKSSWLSKVEKANKFLLTTALERFMATLN